MSSKRLTAALGALVVLGSGRPVGGEVRLGLGTETFSTNPVWEKN